MIKTLVFFKDGHSYGFLPESVADLQRHAPPGFVRLSYSRSIEFVSLDTIAKFIEEEFPDEVMTDGRRETHLMGKTENELAKLVERVVTLEARVTALEPKPPEATRPEPPPEPVPEPSGAHGTTGTSNQANQSAADSADDDAEYPADEDDAEDEAKEGEAPPKPKRRRR